MHSILLQLVLQLCHAVSASIIYGLVLVVGVFVRLDVITIAAGLGRFGH